MQSAFPAALLDPSAAIPAGTVDPQGRPAPTRFSVYRNNVAANLSRAIEASIPVIRKLAGDPFFAAMAVEFALKYPPKSQMLTYYGNDFAIFLEQFPPVANLGYLPDVARLEQAMRVSCHAADVAAIPADNLVAIPESQLLTSRLILAPSVQLIRPRWRIHAIWRANTDAGPALIDVAQDVIILRTEFDPYPYVPPRRRGRFYGCGSTGGQFYDGP